MKRITERHSVVVVTLITSFIGSFAGSALNLAVPSIGEELSIGAISVSWIINGFVLAVAAFAVPFGRLADLIDRRRILNLGILTFALSSGLTVFVHSFFLLIGLRVIQGVGSAMIFGTNQALLISLFPPERRGRMLGLSVAAVYSGLTAGPVLGGILNDQFGWRSIFLVTALAALAAWLVSLRFIPRKPLQLKGLDHRSLDLPGGILYIMTITSLIFGLSMITRLAVARYLLLLSPLCFVLFVRHERRSASPIIQIELFRRDRIYMLSNLAALLNYGATFAVGYLLSIYLQVVRGFDASLSGFILISQPLIMAVLSPLTGRLSDRISPYKLASLGMAFCAAGLVALGFIRPDYPLFLLVVVLVLIGIGFALFSSPNTNAVMSRVPPKDYGVASSVLATMRTIGQSSGLATISFIFAIRVGNIPLHSVPTGMLISAMSLAFLIFSAVCAVGILCSMSRKSQDN